MTAWLARLDDDDPQRQEKVYRLSRYLWAMVTRPNLAGGRGVTVGLTCEDDALCGCLSVLPSSCHEEHWTDFLVAIYHYGLPPAYVRARRLVALQVLAAKRRAHMRVTEKWLYLQGIGVHPESQGKGHGKKMLLWLNGISKAMEAPIYLETESETNVRMYQKLGYRTLEEVDIAAPGDPSKLRMYLMQRDP